MLTASISLGQWKLMTLHAVSQKQKNMALHIFRVTELFAKV